MSEEEKGTRISVTFPKKDADWIQEQVDSGEYTSLAEVVRMCVRTLRAGGAGITIDDAGIKIPTEVAVEAVRNPEVLEKLPATLGPSDKRKPRA